MQNEDNSKVKITGKTKVKKNKKLWKIYEV